LRVACWIRLSVTWESTRASGQWKVPAANMTVPSARSQTLVLCTRSPRPVEVSVNGDCDSSVCFHLYDGLVPG
jgi:hypothetical protein